MTQTHRQRSQAGSRKAATHSPAAARESSQEEAVQTLLAWFANEGHQWPWRETRDRWRILVSEICLQQTQVSRAAPTINRILNAFPTPETLAETDLHELLSLWQGLGYPRRAKNLHAAARVLATDGWPDNYADLPGVGPYTAAAIACFADEQPIVPLDINTRRVITRLFPDGAPTPDDTPIVEELAWSWGQALMELGQRICKAKAQCPDCPVQSYCPSAGTEEVIASPRQSRFEGSFRQRRGRILKRLLVDGSVERSLDAEAADSLVADGLAVISTDGSTVSPPR